ncbi:MAG: Vacuolar protein sorting-associated protein 62 [Geoglossum simile]|nr:MAG: Vacuolar protein sorting-associated protein 62 [Geoglossum simile]
MGSSLSCLTYLVEFPAPLDNVARTLPLVPAILSTFSTLISAGILIPSSLTASPGYGSPLPVVIEIPKPEVVLELETFGPPDNPHRKAPRCSSYTLHKIVSKSWGALYTALDSILRYFLPSHPLDSTDFRVSGEGYEEPRWIASSPSSLDRSNCNRLGSCYGTQLEAADGEDTSWDEGETSPDDWSNDERVLREIPQYVLDYAPLVHLYSGEQFWPCDIQEHLIHTTPYLNYTPLQARSQHPKLTDLDEFNQYDEGRFIFLQSDDNVEERPGWLGGKKNIPSNPGDDNDNDDDEVADSNAAGPWLLGDGDVWVERPNPTARDVPGTSGTVDGEQLAEEIEYQKASASRQLTGGRSDAPAVLLVIDKGNGIVDAFWFFFYSYNLGNVVLNIRFGNHVGDWEHSLVRFEHGVPKAVFFSEHSGGEAYSYEAVEKLGKRPVIYSATGTHAMYAAPGVHEYILPLGLLHDVTDRGPLWDPLLNSHTYTYDTATDTLRSSNITPNAPTQWFYFNGHWGDKIYPLSDPRQYAFAGQYHYVNGPLGPRFKNLDRRSVCQSSNCIIKNILNEPGRRRWEGVGEGEEMSQRDVERFLGGASKVVGEL